MQGMYFLPLEKAHIWWYCEVAWDHRGCCLNCQTTTTGYENMMRLRQKCPWTRQCIKVLVIFANFLPHTERKVKRLNEYIPRSVGANKWSASDLQLEVLWVLMIYQRLMFMYAYDRGLAKSFHWWLRQKAEPFLSNLTCRTDDAFTWADVEAPLRCPVLTLNR